MPFKHKLIFTPHNSIISHAAQLPWSLISSLLPNSPCNAFCSVNCLSHFKNKRQDEKLVFQVKRNTKLLFLPLPEGSLVDTLGQSLCYVLSVLLIVSPSSSLYEVLCQISFLSRLKTKPGAECSLFSPYTLLNF